MPEYTYAFRMHKHIASHTYTYLLLIDVGFLEISPFWNPQK